MAIITPEEWQEIDEKIQYGLTHYGDNISKLLQTYKSIKTVLIDHGFDPDDKLAYTGILEYPIYISKSFIQLEDRIKELNGIITKYEGIFNAIAYGIAKIGQKALREIAIVESQLFPEYAVGTTLDDVAKRYGIFSRLGASQSSVYIYLYGQPGTVYNKNNCYFVSNDGISFRLNNNVTVGEFMNDIKNYIYIF